MAKKGVKMTELKNGQEMVAESNKAPDQGIRIRELALVILSDCLVRQMFQAQNQRGLI